MKIIVQPCRNNSCCEYHIYEATHKGKIYFIRRKKKKGATHYTSQSYAKLMTERCWESGKIKFFKTL